MPPRSPTKTHKSPNKQFKRPSLKQFAQASTFLCTELSKRPPVVCDSIDQLENCLALLEPHKVICLDCEGVRLGRDGSLCLIQIATPLHVVIFDITCLGASVFDAGLRAILENPNVLKIFHDVRCDSDALFHLHQTTLCNVFDTQGLCWRWTLSIRPLT